MSSTTQSGVASEDEEADVVGVVALAAECVNKMPADVATPVAAECVNKMPGVVVWVATAATPAALGGVWVAAFAVGVEEPEVAAEAAGAAAFAVGVEAPEVAAEAAGAAAIAVGAEVPEVVAAFAVGVAEAAALAVGVEVPEVAAESAWLPMKWRSAKVRPMPMKYWAFPVGTARGAGGRPGGVGGTAGGGGGGGTAGLALGLVASHCLHRSTRKIWRSLCT